MYFFLDADRRKIRGGTLYLEFQPGPYREALWRTDSLYLPAPLFDDLGLYDLFVRAIPHFNYYHVTEVGQDQFHLLKELAEAHHTQCAAEILAELTPYAERWMKEHGCFTICGI